MIQMKSSHSILSALLVAALLALAGCHEPTAGPAANPSTQRADERIDPTPAAGAAEPAAAADAASCYPAPPADDLGGGKLVEEFWDAYWMQGSRVGYARTTVVTLAEGGRELVRTRNFMHLALPRSGQTATQQVTATSWDTPDGRLVRFESRMSAGPGDVVVTGAVEGGQLKMEVATLGRKESQQIPWQAEWGGLFAPDQSLRQKPLAPGETRTVRSLLPFFNIPGDTRLTAGDLETVELPTGKTKLLRVNSVTDMAAQKIEQIQWVNDRGETVKSVVPSIGQEAIRTTKEEALRRPAGEKFDLMVASAVPLKGTLPHPPLTKRAVYRARVKSGQIDGLFSECLSQRVKKVDDQTAEITVLAVRPEQPAKLDLQPTRPTDADSAPNNYVQSDDPLIVKLAAAVAPKENDPWKLACALEKFVDETIREKSFSQAFATAAEVARTLEGDCTEHAVLMAALCRARKVPARGVFGLVYYPPQKGFAYHMWDEVWIADRWVPVDPTRGLGGVGADHIKLGDSNLAGGSPLADLISVIQVFGRLELEVVAAD